MPDTADHLERIQRLLNDRSYAQADRLRVATLALQVVVNRLRNPELPADDFATEMMDRLVSQYVRKTNKTLMAFAGGPDE